MLDQILGPLWIIDFSAIEFNIERWLALATGRCGSGSNPTAENFASELWQFPLPRFGRSVPSIWCICQGK